MNIGTAHSCIVLVFFALFTAGTTSAQTPDGNSTYAYLGFSQFTTIKAANKLRFFDRLKWAGMVFVNAPAAKRVAALYEYKNNEIASADCSDNELRDQFALLVTQLVPTEAVLANHEAQIREAGSLEFTLRDTPWLTRAGLKDLLPNELKEISDEAPTEPVWHELSFSNSCDLKETITSLDYQTLTWSRAENPKLRSIIRSGAESLTRETSFKAQVILASPLFSKQAVQKQYFAQCKPVNDLRHARTLLCGARIR